MHSFRPVKTAFGSGHKKSPEKEYFQNETINTQQINDYMLNKKNSMPRAVLEISKPQREPRKGATEGEGRFSSESDQQTAALRTAQFNVP